MASASRKEQRSVIRFFAIQCESAAKIHKKLVDVTYGVMPYVVQRFELGKKFEEGRANVPDLPRAGRPKTMVTATNAAHVEEMVMANRRISINEISERLNISSGSVHTIIHDHYLLPAITQRRPEKARGRFLLQQDNAPPHRALVVKAALEEDGIKVLKHPPYSPDLAPSDYWLFSDRRSQLRGRKFGSRSALGTAIYQYRKKTPTQSFRTAIQDLIKRWDRCVRMQGEFGEV